MLLEMEILCQKDHSSVKNDQLKISKQHAHLHTMTRKPAKFQMGRPIAVKGVPNKRFGMNTEMDKVSSRSPSLLY